MRIAALTIPPGPAHVRTARLLAAGVARQAGFDEEGVDNVRLAVTEACLLHLGLNEPVEVEFDLDQERLTVMVGPNAAPSVTEPESQLAMTVLRAVAPRFELAANGLVMAWPRAAS
jgi:anti-sigma regulatory factor (Ser/Thr protein kinase)